MDLRIAVEFIISKHGSFMTRVAVSGRALSFGPSADCGSAM